MDVGVLRMRGHNISLQIFSGFYKQIISRVVGECCGAESRILLYVISFGLLGLILNTEYLVSWTMSAFPLSKKCAGVVYASE
jgi:hypothetical protein